MRESLPDKTPLVSIGIPTYNRCKTLAKAIDSALQQDYKNLEIVICDNASTDNTEALVSRYLKLDDRVKYHRSATNQGPLVNFLSARDLCNGKYFMWLADDDYLEPNYVSACLSELQRDNTLVIVGGRPRFFGGKYEGNGKAFRLLSTSPIVRLAQFYWGPYDNSIFYGLMRSEMAKSNSFTRSVIGDWLFTAGMAAQGKLLTTDNTTIHRQGGGTSASIADMSRVSGVPKWHFICLGTMASIAAAQEVFSNPAYSAIPCYKKWVLAGVVFAVNILRSGFVRVLQLAYYFLLVSLLGEARYEDSKIMIKHWLRINGAKTGMATLKDK